MSSDQMTDQAAAKLHDRILALACNGFGLTPSAGARLLAEAQADIERNEREPSSDAAITRAVAATRRQLIRDQEVRRRD